MGSSYKQAKREGWAHWIRNVHDERAVEAGCIFREEKAQEVRDFFLNYLRHSKGRKFGGKPFELLDDQWEDIIGPIFGWMQPDGRTRRIKVAYVEIPKKNYKSTFASGIGLYLLVGDGEPGAEVYSCATKRDQASIVHKEAITMVRRSPALLSELRINESTYAITHPASNSVYKALSADAGGSEGLHAHGRIYDELHVWKDRKFWDSLYYAGIGRDQPVNFIITTAGVADRTSIGWEQHERALKWLDGKLEDQEYLAYIRCADATRVDDDEYILDPKTHKLANPGFGVTIDPTEIAKAARDAVEHIEQRRNFVRYRLNIWIDDESSPWMDMGHWRKCGAAVDESKLAGRKCFGGLDLANKLDIAAWMLLFPPDDDDEEGLWYVLPRIFCPTEGAKDRERTNKVKYLNWADKGLLTLTPGTEIDYSAIRTQIEKDRETFDFGLESIGGDPWNLTHLRQELDPDCQYIVEVTQNFENLSPATKKLQSLVYAGKLAHGGHELLEWCAGNVRILEDTNGNMRPSKKHSIEKIDPLVGLVMAVGRAIVPEDDVEPRILSL